MHIHTYLCGCTEYLLREVDFCGRPCDQRTYGVYGTPKELVGLDVSRLIARRIYMATREVGGRSGRRGESSKI